MNHHNSEFVKKNSKVPDSIRFKFKTSSFDELRTFLSKHYVNINLSNSKRMTEVDSEVDILRLPNTCISHLNYSPMIVMKMQADQARYNLSLSTKGHFELNIGSRTLCGDQSTATLSSPSYEKRIKLGLNSSRYNISFNQSAMVDLLEQLLGQAISSPLEFDTSLKLNTAAGQQINILINQFLGTFKMDPCISSYNALATQFEQLMMTILLYHQPHNYSDEINNNRPFPLSADVKRVIDYIEENLKGQILLADLVKISGVPGRTLYSHFNRFIGKTPMQYITERRLYKVRKDLLANDQDEGVTDIAMRWGFLQLGRFSGLYKRTYGELPSTTLQRSSVAH